MPTVHIEAAVTSFAVGYQEQEFAAAKIYPIVPVSKKNDKYWLFGKEQFDAQTTRRGADGSYTRVKHDQSNVSYLCEEDGLEEPIDKSEIDNADDPVRPKETAAAIIKQQMLISLERRLALEILTTNSPTTTVTNSGSSAATGQWDNATADPILQVKTARAAIRALGGPKPNRIAIGSAALSILKQHPLITNRVIYGGLSMSGGIVSNAALAALFEVDEVIELDQVYNTAKQGQATSLSNIWGKIMLQYYFPKTPRELLDLRTPMWGCLPFWKIPEVGGQIMIAESYDEPQRNSTVIRLRSFNDELTTGKDFAALNKAVVA